MQGEGSERLWALADYVRVIRRQKYFVLAAILFVPALALVMSLRQQELFEAKAQVLISPENLAASLTGTQSSQASQQSDRIAATDAKLARVSPVLQRVLKAARVRGMTIAELRDRSHVGADPTSNILTFSVTWEEPRGASVLATQYARQFTLYQRELDSLPLARALRAVESRLQQLPSGGGSQRALYESLINKEQQLRAMEALGSANTFVVQEGDSASKVQPKPVRAVALGVGLGVLLGVGLAFLIEALDRRVRGHEEVQERLSLPLLARLRAPRKRSESWLAMLDDPYGAEAEEFRVFRSNVELANLRYRARTLMVTSALAGEGKTTGAANLALAFAQNRRRVILVDLDLRRPSLHRLFRLDAAPGLTDVALGHASLDEVLADVDITRADAEVRTSQKESRAPGGNLLVLTAGAGPVDPANLVGTEELRTIFGELRSRADIVVIDTPPLLQVSDGLSLSTEVDAILVVANMRRVTRPIVKELARVLDMCPAAKLGFAIAGGEIHEDYGYAYLRHQQDPDRPSISNSNRQQGAPRLPDSARASTSRAAPAVQHGEPTIGLRRVKGKRVAEPGAGGNAQDMPANGNRLDRRSEEMQLGPAEARRWSARSRADRS
jgi:capsular exopolysaccharide synthesis family protein